MLGKIEDFRLRKNRRFLDDGAFAPFRAVEAKSADTALEEGNAFKKGVWALPSLRNRANAPCRHDDWRFGEPRSFVCARRSNL